MFCDLVGSTALAERLDPEELRDALDATAQEFGRRQCRAMASYCRCRKSFSRALSHRAIAD